MPAVGLPPPYACGAPDVFDRWRAGQAEALTRIIDANTRAVGCALPTGAGKSLIAATIATLTGWRTAILTSTKALQDQIGYSFQTIGIRDLRGQVNYPCRALDGVPGPRSCDVGPCKVGWRCPWRDKGCSYYDAVHEATKAPILVTNYAAWMSQYAYLDGLGAWDCLILDEAHAAPEEVGQFLAEKLTPRQLEDAGVEPPAGASWAIAQWIKWATANRAGLSTQVEQLSRLVTSGGGTAVLFTRLRSLKHTLRTLDKLAAIANADDWIARGDDRDGWEFHPIHVAQFVEGALLRGIPRIVLTSATLTRKTAEALGFDPQAMTWIDAPSLFPVERRPVIHVSTCRIDHRLDAAGVRLWLSRVDQILDRRGDRKGLIHTGSYARADLIRTQSRHRARLILHTRATAADAIARFRRAGPGAVLVSPSMTTGVDFPGRDCEFQIILKVPWPDSREPVMQARTARDKSYPAYLAMQDLVQAVGRGMRSEDDQCETIILDDHIRWFIVEYRKFAPRWFLDAYRSQLTIPAPPPPLP